MVAFKAEMLENIIRKPVTVNDIAMSQIKNRQNTKNTELQGIAFLKIIHRLC